MCPFLLYQGISGKHALMRPDTPLGSAMMATPTATPITQGRATGESVLWLGFGSRPGRTVAANVHPAVPFNGDYVVKLWTVCASLPPRPGKPVLRMPLCVSLCRAPIMGSAYTKEVTQFSRGEYSSASNKEDDVQIIGKFLPLIAQEQGTTTTTATSLVMTQVGKNTTATPVGAVIR